MLATAIVFILIALVVLFNASNIQQALQGKLKITFAGKPEQGSRNGT